MPRLILEIRTGEELGGERFWLLCASPPPRTGRPRFRRPDTTGPACRSHPGNGRRALYAPPRSRRPPRVRLRATRSQKKASRTAPDSVVAACLTRGSRDLSVLTPVATVTATLTTRQPSSTLIVSVPATNAYKAVPSGPGAELFDVHVEILGHFRDLRPFDG